MKKFNWKSLLPHVIAVAIFLLIAVIYCKPVLEGKVLQQTDITNWKGMAQNSFEYKEKHGRFPLWNTHLFSGMPNYQVAMDSKGLLPDFNTIFTLGLPKPVNFFFLACICFYILCMVFSTNYAIAILGSLAYAYSTYNPIIINVGHDTKMMAIAYMPALLAGLILIYEKKYVIGLFVTALFATLEIAANHPQINYYFAIIAAFVTISYIIKWVKAHEWKHMFIAFSLSALAVLIGLGNSAISLLTTAEYTKYTMRGGKTIDNSGAGLKQVKTTGLDEDYGFSYSAGKSEFLTFLMPNAFGSSSEEAYDENSKIVTALTDKNVPEEQAVQVATSTPKYWGGILPSTSGPVYFGAIICILFIIGLVLVDDKYRWWILAASLFAVVISWGKYFEGFNGLLFEHLPMYNKFRAPSMATVIPQLLFPLLAVLALQKVFFSDYSKQYLQKSFKKILYITGGVFVILLLVYFASDFSSEIDPQIIKGYTNPQTGSNEFGHIIVNAMIQERKAMFGTDLFQALIFAVVTIGVLFIYLRTSVKPVYLVIALLIINTANLLVVDNKYLNADKYVESDSYQSNNFTPTSAAVDIMKDKDPHYRVYSLSPDRYQEALTAYFLRCVGGYHPAKLRIYQDILDNQVDKNNKSVLNMLDTKYFIVPPQQQQQQYSVIKNDSALGACWFVKEVKFVNGPVEEMNALDKFDPSQTAVVDNSFKSIIPGQPASDPSAKIKLDSYDNDDIKYSTTANTNQFAVLSEVYYPAGWQAYIDGKKTGYTKVNYVLRGIPVPAGTHSIEFKFEPASYYNGQVFAYIANILTWLSIIATIWFIWNKRYKTVAKT